MGEYNMPIFTGSATAIVTPFNEDTSINFEQFERLIDFQLENQTDALVICGTTGEASTLADDEHIECIRFTASYVKKRVPIIAGAGSNHTEHGIELCKKAQQAGADALMLVTPYYNKATQKGLVEHFEIMAKSTDLPIIIYNVPARTNLNILPETMNKLSKIENIVATKEASGDLKQIAEIAYLCGDRTDIYSGNDEDTLCILALGGKGVISVLANIAPKNIHDLCTQFFEGNLEASRAQQLKSVPMVKELFREVSPVPVKTALNLMGMNAGPCRRPLTTIDDTNKELLIKAMKAYGLR
jgi:4-hydroxy-tetrahydrodipicolinate synthase